MSSTSRKHPLPEDSKDDSSSQEYAAKRANLDSALLSLSDEILIEILKGVTTRDLLVLSTTCFRLNNLIRDKQFWIETDFTAFPLSLQQITRNLKYLHVNTRSLKIRGLVSHHPHDKWKNATLTTHFLKQLAQTCPKLEHVTVYEGCIDISKVQIVHFPATLKSLVFHRCKAVATLHTQSQPTSFFTGVDEHLKALEEFRMEECSWFRVHDLIDLSKLPKLRLLSLRGCSSLKQCIPYGSIATRFGFKALEVLDIRNTPVSNLDIQCFNECNSLKQLLMECPENLRNQEAEPSAEQPAEGARDASAQNQYRIIQVFARARLMIAQQVAELEAAALPGPSAEGQQQNREENSPPQAEAEGQAEVPAPAAPAPDQVPVPVPHFIMIRDYPGLNDIAQHVEEAANLIPIIRGFIQVNDSGICSFGQSRNGPQPRMACIDDLYYNPDNLMERLTVRHYSRVTDVSLRRLISCAPNLKFLDVTGTSVTESGVAYFRAGNPKCELISSFD